MPVCTHEGKLRGMITDRDIAIRGATGDLPLSAKVKTIMSKGIVSVDARADVKEALELMASHKIRRLPVTSNGSVIGMVSLGDISNSNNYNMEAGQALKDISRHDKM